MNQKHNLETWFGAGDEKFLEYFQNEFEGNTMGTLKFPASHARVFNNLATMQDKYDAAKGIATAYLGGIVKLKSKQLKRTPFSLLEEDTRTLLKDAVCEAVQHAIYNKNVWERMNASSLTTNSFAINQDTPGWILTADIYGKFGWNNIQNSGIDDYQWVEEEALAVETAGRNIKLIARTDALEETFWKVA